MIRVLLREQFQLRFKLSQCGTPAEAVGAYLSASTVSGDGARSEAGAAVVGAGVSGHSRAGAAGWAEIYFGMKRRPLRLS